MEIAGFRNVVNYKPYPRNEHLLAAGTFFIPRYRAKKKNMLKTVVNSAEVLYNKR